MSTKNAARTLTKSAHQALASTATSATTAGTSTTASATPAPKTYFRIKQIRSSIGLPLRTAAALKALGLQKRMRTVFHPVNADVAGQIFKVKELVAVKEVSGEEVKTRSQLKEERRPHPGFWVERVGDGRGMVDSTSTSVR